MKATKSFIVDELLKPALIKLQTYNINKTDEMKTAEEIFNHIVKWFYAGRNKTLIRNLEDWEREIRKDQKQKDAQSVKDMKNILAVSKDDAILLNFILVPV